MRRESGGTTGDEQGQGQAGPESEDGDVLTQMIQTLLQEADTPPKEVEGVSEEFCAGMYDIYLCPLLPPGRHGRSTC